MEGAAEAPEQVLRMGEFAFLLVALRLRFNNAEEQGFKFPQVFPADRYVNTEPIPQLAVAVLQVGVEPPSKVAGQTDVVKFSTPIECINPLPVPDVLPDDLLVFGKGIAANVFKVLADQL